jgi:hypothetical protein
MIISEHSIIKTLLYIMAQLGVAVTAVALMPLLYTAYTHDSGHPYDIAAAFIRSSRENSRQACLGTTYYFRWCLKALKTSI